MDPVLVSNDAGYDIPIHWTPADGEGPVFVVLGALGTPAPFYRRLAAALAGHGWPVAVVEQRGMGASGARPSRDQDWDFTDVVGTDLPVAVDWVRARAPGRPLIVLGHSLGGHYAQMLVGTCPDKVDALVLAACGSPWVEGYDGPVRAKIEHLVEAIPALAEEHGYYPGNLVGFGGDDAAGVMADWRHLARTNRYRFAGDDTSLAPRIASYAGPVLAIRMAEDNFAPDRSVQACVDRFVASPPEQRVLDAAEIGADADHFGWAKELTAVVATIAEWLRLVHA